MQVSLEASRPEGCAGMSETGQTTNGTRELFGNKDESSSECTACMFVAVPHLKASPRLGCNRLWFHVAHLSDNRPTNNSWDETSLCSPPKIIVMEQLVKNGTRGQNLERICWNGSDSILFKNGQISLQANFEGRITYLHMFTRTKQHHKNQQNHLKSSE